MGAPAAIEDGIVTRLSTITGLRAYDSQPDKIIPPCAWPELTGDEGFVTMGGLDRVYLYDLYLVVPAQKGRRSGRDLLAPYTALSGAQSIPAALLADTTLGGAADDLRNLSLAQHGRIEVKDVEYVGAIWRVEVMAQ